MILAVRPDLLHLSIPWLEDDARPPLIAVTTYESPTILELMLRIDAQSAVTTPVRSFGLLSATRSRVTRAAGMTSTGAASRSSNSA
ncbi:hypothetical protein [Burkholderia sp. Tr-20390]|uniref:hypothetical protein n=1 Tax=Burkholderia sp. Tr-20390 TaxID=2703904 RepID=UPI00197CFE5E|nr:hypothetical protein [Burkholderia sp. Tr-20390]MBN3735612.1 hypothetical protein [Burkholderia sp. Tr-20390]